jgi:hypothetical protein
VSHGGEASVPVMQDDFHAHPYITHVHQEIPVILHLNSKRFTVPPQPSTSDAAEGPVRQAGNTVRSRDPAGRIRLDVKVVDEFHIGSAFGRGPCQ